MTLAIIDDLTPGNLTGGKRVAVTGTITADGKVGEIGGLPQKAVAAKAAHAQIFIVPVCVDDPQCTEDLKVARARVGKHVDVEPVATLAQALHVLRAAGGSPVSREVAGLVGEAVVRGRHAGHSPGFSTVCVGRRALRSLRCRRTGRRRERVSAPWG